jgi:hypothetical protein
MAYVAQWERLSDASHRVITVAGVSKDEAQTDICQAIADGTIKIRCKLERHTTRQLRSKTVLEGKSFDIPTKIRPQDLDWEGSRSVKPWMVRRGTSALPGYWDLEWIELSRTDVTNVLCSAGTHSEAAQPASSETGATSRSRPALERAQRAVKGLYPQGVPEQAAEPNAKLCRRVGDELNKEGLPGVSDDTILRAAGRRN